jgi:hypothetical protein
MYVDQFKEVVDYCLPKGGQAAVKKTAFLNFKLLTGDA